MCFYCLFGWIMCVYRSDKRSKTFVSGLVGDPTRGRRPLSQGKLNTTPAFGRILLRFHLWEKQDILYRIRIGHDHGEAIDSYAKACCRWHAVFEGT